MRCVKYINYVILAATILFVGCSTFGISGPKTTSRDKLMDKQEQIQDGRDKSAKNDDKRLSQIGVLAKGSDFAMDKITTPDIRVDIARQLNDRVISLANNPNVGEVIRIKKIVEDLISSVDAERAKGQLELSKLDDELKTLQKDKVKIELALDKKSKEFEDLSFGIAKKTDDSAAVIDGMNKWFGLGAVYYGCKKFLASSILILVIFTVLFLILKVAASTNPIAAGIFHVFNLAGSGILYVIKLVVPKSFSVANFVPSNTYDFYKGALNKIVDTFEKLKRENLLLPPEKQHTLADISLELAKVMDESDKKAVTECLKELKWV